MKIRLFFIVIDSSLHTGFIKKSKTKQAAVCSCRFSPGKFMALKPERWDFHLLKWEALLEHQVWKIRCLFWGDVPSVLDTESLWWLFAILAEMSSRQLEFGADVGNCPTHGVLESSSSKICKVKTGNNKRAPRVRFHTDREDVLGQSLVFRGQGGRKEPSTKFRWVISEEEGNTESGITRKPNEGSVLREWLTTWKWLLHQRGRRCF